MALIAEFRAMASDLLARSQIARRLGQTFGGNRDLYSVLGYKEHLDINDYRFRYERGGIAGRIIDVKPEATWREGTALIEDERPEIITPFEAAFDALDQTHDIWNTLKRADVLGGIGRYSVILLVDGAPLGTPMQRASGPEKLLQLTPFAEDDATFDSKDIDASGTSARFGWPEFYHIKRVSGKSVSTKVHWTRCIHIAEGCLDDNVFGPPKLKRIWNYLDDLDKIAGGGSEAFWVRAHQGYMFSLDKDAKLDEPEKQKMRDEIDEFFNGMRRSLRMQGVDAKVLGSDVADFKGPASAIVELICSSIGVPQRILLGSERGELASSEDRNNFRDLIADRRSQYAHPVCVKRLVNRLIEYNFLPTPKQFTTRWPDESELDEQGKADIAVKLTKANQQQGEMVVTTNEIRDHVWGYAAITPTPNRGIVVPEPEPAPAGPRVTVHTAPAPPISVTPHIEIHIPALPRTGSKVLEYDNEGRLIRITPQEADDSARTV